MNLPDNFVATDEFTECLDLIERTNGPFFITGNAGTGKSTFLQWYLENTPDSPVVLAPTGVAAVNVGGTTIHSFFKFPPRYQTLDSIHYDAKWKFHHSLRVLVIDEISMVRADMLDNIDIFLRKNMQNDSPFGGVKVIMIGDLRQLPPVVEESLSKFFNDVYTSPFFFSAKVFEETNMTRYTLTHCFRQSDPDFIRILNNVRDGRLTLQDSHQLNKRVRHTVTGSAIMLTTTNNTADAYNQLELNKIISEPHTYNAEIDGDFQAKFYPTSESLVLKTGAQVMMLRNGQGYCNGTICTVEEMTNDYVCVSIETDDPEHPRKVYIKPVSWERIEYDSVDGAVTHRQVGKFTQLPLKLAWAITMHKSQGLTFDRVKIDFGRGSFAHGQTYVALSRCRTLEGISLMRSITKRDIVFDASVLKCGVSS
jgi:ATP-dependent exoDNAse (exonuclease V) alpha subunit